MVRLSDPLVELCLRLGDSALVLGHRLSEWSSKAPTLEEDIALSNIALDLIGQARVLLTHAGEVEGAGRD
jgi:ring-1,2-phenylacetyl-CoA epoxidase subunit PaaC